MTNLISVVKPEILMENKMTIHHFLKESYYGARRKLEDGISFIQEGVSFFRDEFSGIYKRANESISRLELPVNNFLKDPVELESEIKQQLQTEQNRPVSCTIVPVEIAMQSPLEENY